MRTSQTTINHTGRTSSLGRLCVRLIQVALFAFTIVVAASPSRAQNIQFTQGDVGSGLHNTLQIQLKAYPGRGASLPVNLYYSTAGLWRIGQLRTVDQGTYYQTITEAIYAEHSIAGWKTSLDLPKIEWPHQYDGYFYSGGPYNFTAYSPAGAFRVRRVYIHMPDGSRHEMRENDQPYQGPIDMVGTFYAVDGSRLRYDSTGATTGTLYLPDGSRYELFELNGSAARFIDRNGNTLSYDAATGLWRDTLNRPISKPLSSNPTPGTQDYYLPGMPLPYRFVWKNLSDTGVLTNPSATAKPIANEYLPHPDQPPTNSSGNNYPVTIQSTYGEWPSLFVSDTPDDGALTLVVGRGQQQDEPFNPVVLTEIIYPNGLSYKFSYNIYGEIDKIIYPTGAYEQYTFSRVPDISGSQVPYVEANRAITKRQLSANGNGNDIAEWTYSVEAFGQDLPPNSMRITTKAPNNTYTEVYRQKLPPPVHGNKPFWAFGFEDGRNGMVFDERIYAPNADGSKGPMLRRSLTEWQSTTNPVPPRLGVQGETTETAYRNTRPIKQVSLILDTGGNALAKLVTYGYISNQNHKLTTGLDRTDMAESHFASIDQPPAQTGTIETISTYNFPAASRSETTYVDDPNYQARHILGLVTRVELFGPTGQQPVSKSETFYDEVGTFLLITYPDLAGDQGYTDPGIGTVRGNATTVRRYIDVNGGTFLQAHAQFDQCGNVVNTWNERATAPFTDANASSRNEYSTAYRHAYLTQTTSAVPDPTGAHGSNTPFMSASSFDAVTGLVLTATDINGQTTQFSYSDDQGMPDSLNRLRKVTRPDGGWTKFSFGETLGNLFTLTETQQDATRTVKSYQYADPMGRASHSFASEGGANYIASDAIYDQMGRVWKVSNPYRTTTLNGVADLSHTTDWTVSHYDAMSRVDYVTLPDAQQVLTSYQGIYTTVTDQAGRQRRQKTDALGRIVRVDEPNLSGSLGTVDAPTQPTFYEYNTQGNLIHINQGSGTSTPQHRYFKFDALGRLTYERQVEQAGTHTASDPLTGNSAWSRRLIYDETIGGVTYSGLLTSAYDARNIQTQFSYDNLNRIWQVNYSDGTPTVTNNYDQTRPGFLNRGHLTEALTEAVTGPTAPVPATSQVYNFDLMGRVANNQQTVGEHSYSMSYGHNIGGALTSQTYPSGRVISYAFDDAARLSQVLSGSKIYANQFDYSTTQGLLKSMTLGNGAVESYTYNSRLQLKSIDLTKSSTQLQHYDYTYGVYNSATNTVDETKNTGQIARIEGFIATAKQWQQNFAYDSLGRLSSARESRGDNSQQSWLVNYEYDLFGNRYQKQAQNGGNPFTQKWTESGDINQATNRYATGVTYDNAGNVLTDPKFRNLQFQYDANNRQKQSANSDGSNAVVSVYDAGGQRVGAQVEGVLTIVLVYDAGGLLVAEYGSSPPVGGTQYITTDHQDSPRVVTTAVGTVLTRHDYLPFGEELGHIGMRNSGQGYGAVDNVRHRYAGMESDDATGMAHTLWRKYDALSGRWSGPDPYDGSMEIDDPQSFNRYSYVLNDPVNETDPLGLMAGADQGWGSAASGFWGSSAGFNEPHFGGPEVIGARLMLRDGVKDPSEGLIWPNNPTSPQFHHAHAYNGDEEPDPVIVIDTFAFISRHAAINYFTRLFGGSVAERNGKFVLDSAVRLRNWQNRVGGAIDAMSPFGFLTRAVVEKTLGAQPADETSAEYRQGETAVVVASVIVPGPGGKLGAVRGTVRHAKLIKNIVRNASKPGVTLSDAKIAQLGRVVHRAGGRIRTEVGQQGSVKGILHSHVIGFGSRVGHRHIIHANQVP